MPAEPLTVEGQGFFDVPLPLGLLADIARAEPNAYFAAAIPPTPLHHVDPSSSAQAHAIHNADAWHRASYTGQGVTVGVIDVGFKNYPAMQAQGEVPMPAGGAMLRRPLAGFTQPSGLRRTICTGQPLSRR